MKTFRTYIKSLPMRVLCLVVILISLHSCKKFLDQKPNKKLVEPSTIQDVQALLDNYYTLNTFAPNIGALSDDDFYLKDDFLNSLQINDRNAYTWQKDIELDESWKFRYQIVLQTNLALETLNKISRNDLNRISYDNAYGGALFFRSLAFFHLAEVFAPSYDAKDAKSSLGIPVRLASDINTVNKRSTIEETYSQIISDLKMAIPLLPSKNNLVTQASKAAAYALLSNTYLTMRNYHCAGLFADSVLQIQNSLLDYNNFDPASAAPFTQFNEEVIFFSQTAGGTSLYTSNRKVDTTLFSLYQENDLRKWLFFQLNGENEYGFKGNYQGRPNGNLFNGFAVDEILLIRAECAARENKKEDAIKDLNTLLVKRYKVGEFITIENTSVDDVLQLVLAERRKELISRGKRWMDLRRLNKESQFEKTLARVVNGEIFELLPNSLRYTFYIPMPVIKRTDMVQNER